MVSLDRGNNFRAPTSEHYQLENDQATRLCLGLILASATTLKNIHNDGNNEIIPDAEIHMGRCCC